MMSSLKTYGFEYQYSNRKFAFSLEAESMEEARARVSALAMATPVGELHPEDENTAEKDISN